MADNGMIGNGTRVGFRVADSPLGAFTPVGQLLNVEGLEVTRDKVNSTVHSPNIFKRNMPGMAEVSDLMLNVLANPNEVQGSGIVQELLVTKLLSGETVNWRVEVPIDRAQSAFKGYEFDGFVLSWKHGKPIEDRQTYDFAICFDDITFTRDPAGAAEVPLV